VNPKKYQLMVNFDSLFSIQVINDLFLQSLRSQNDLTLRGIANHFLGSETIYWFWFLDNSSKWKTLPLIHLKIVLNLIKIHFYIRIILCFAYLTYFYGKKWWKKNLSSKCKKMFWKNEILIEKKIDCIDIYKIVQNKVLFL
jgi:hypothetical protein